jgi:hypothetical protein
MVRTGLIAGSSSPTAAQSTGQQLTGTSAAAAGPRLHRANAAPTQGPCKNVCRPLQTLPTAAGQSGLATRKSTLGPTIPGRR